MKHFPDQFHEIFGNPILTINHILDPQPFLSLPRKLLGLTFNNPTGMPSGWADTIEKMEFVQKLGAGIVISKTITVQPRQGNPYPRLIRGRYGLINSMGLPNFGLKWWINQLEKSQDKLPKPRIFSIKGDDQRDWTVLVNELEHYADILELNLSCPNVQEGIMDLDISMQAVRDISSITKCKVILKLSPEYQTKQNVDFISKIRDCIDGITATNTLPIKHNKLGNPKKRGGLSGKPIYQKMYQLVKQLRFIYQDMDELPIFATGGIMNIMQARNIYYKLDAFPLSLTGFLMNGPNFYNHIMKSLIDKK